MAIRLILPGIIILVALSVACWFGLDLAVSDWAFATFDGWSGGRQPWAFLYAYGPIPAWIVAMGGLFFAGSRTARGGNLRHARAGLFLFAVTVAGPGILINGILKPAVQRPRPAEIDRYGGQYDFLPLAAVGTNGHSKSFPSGHASVGFVLMAPAFILFRRSIVLSTACFATGILCGGVIGLARIVQGGHYLSDVIWSGGVVYFTCVTLYYAFRLDQPSENSARLAPDHPCRSVLDSTPFDKIENRPAA